MIKFGLKLWTTNVGLVEKAAELYKEKEIDFIELYHQPDGFVETKNFELIKDVPVVIHNTHDRGFHEFIVNKDQLNIWEDTKRLSDFFSSKHIVVHPGKSHSFESFKIELKKLDDPRILIENMAGLDINHEEMYAQTVEQLQQICKTNPICFDFEKAVKAACYQGRDYKEFILECLEKLEPKYFHISGGDKDSAVDEHKDLWDSNIDFGWIKKELEKIAKNEDVWLVFETPKENGLQNDKKNMEFFKKLN